MIGFRLVGERLEPGDRMAPEVSTPVPGKKETQVNSLGFLGVAIVCVWGCHAWRLSPRLSVAHRVALGCAPSALPSRAGVVYPDAATVGFVPRRNLVDGEGAAVGLSVDPFFH